MKKYTLTAHTRTLYGRKVKSLRKQGQLPATIYGRKIDSVSIAIDHKNFESVHAEAGETGLIDLTIDKTSRPVLIHSVQIDPVSGATLHVEFHQVDLKEKVHAKVPLRQTGESPAVAQRVGALLWLLDEVEVEALPTELPEAIEVDVSTLSTLDQEIHVSDLTVRPGVTVLTDPGLTVVRVTALVSKEAEAQAAAEAAEKAAAATVEAGTAEPSATPESTTAPVEPKAPAEQKKE